MVPLVSAQVDLRSIHACPFDASEVALAASTSPLSGDVWRMRLSLQAASWHQVPAASLPNDDLLIASICGLGRNVAALEGLHEEVMAGFVRCDDGRWYHEKLSVQANDAWARLCAGVHEDVEEQAKIERRRSQGAARMAKLRARRGSKATVTGHPMASRASVFTDELTTIAADEISGATRGGPVTHDVTPVTRHSEQCDASRDASRDAVSSVTQRHFCVTSGVKDKILTQSDHDLRHSSVTKVPQMMDFGVEKGSEKASGGREEGGTIGGLESGGLLPLPFAAKGDSSLTLILPTPEDRSGKEIPSSSPSLVQKKGTTKKIKAEGGATKPAKAVKRVPDIDTPITERAIRFAAERGHDADEANWQWNRLLGNAVAAGRPYADLDLAFRNWLDSPYFVARPKPRTGVPARTDTPTSGGRPQTTSTHATRYRDRLIREAEEYHANSLSGSDTESFQPEIPDENRFLAYQS